MLWIIAAILVPVCFIVFSRTSQKNENDNRVYKGVEIMEKLDALLLKDEEGTHYVPIANIRSV